MSWIRRQPLVQLHRCVTPTCDVALMDFTYEAPDGQHGDMWRCDVCGKLWWRGPFDWRSATRWRRFRYRRVG